MNNRYAAIAFFSSVCVLGYLLPAAALSPVEVQRIAKHTTVRIKTCSNGSGVIIQKSGNSYTVLTAAHATSAKGCQIVTADDREYAVDRVITFTDSVDLAIVKFTSSQTYPTAKTIDNSDRLEGGETVYVSGFPVTTTISEPIFTFIGGKVIGNGNKLQTNGYSLVYDNPTLPGHSGGPVWNDRGEVVAIHGRGDIDSKIKETESPNVRIKTGFNLGIVINTFAKIAAKMGISGELTTVVATTVPVKVAAPPKPVDDLVVSAIEKEKRGDYRGILADMNRAIAIDPNKDRLYYIRANAKTELGDLQGAIEDYNRDIAKHPDRAVAYYNRGNARYKLRDWQSALADYSRAIEIDPKPVAALYNRANVKYNLQDKQGSLADYNRALAIEPKLLAAYTSRAWVKYELGDYQGAIADNDRAIAMKHPRLAKAYTQKALASYELGDLAAAMAAWRKALTLPGVKQDIQIGLASALYRQGDRSESLQLAESAIRTDNKIADLQYFKDRKWGAKIVKDLATLLQQPQLKSIR